MRSANEKMLASAFCDAMSEKYADELALCECDPVCSAAHYKKMSAIIGKRVGTYARSVKRTVCALILAAALLLAGCAAYAYRREIGGFFEKVRDGFIEVGGKSTAVDKNAGAQAGIPEIPNGYHLVGECSDGAGYMQKYLSDDGGYMILALSASKNTKLIMNINDVPSSVIKVRDREVYCHTAGGVYSYVWYCGEKIAIISTDKMPDHAELERVIGGMN